jgi:hypothetical protein
LKLLFGFDASKTNTGLYSSSPINSLLVIDERMFATGDDQGVIKVSYNTSF